MDAAYRFGDERSGPYGDSEREQQHDAWHSKRHRFANLISKEHHMSEARVSFDQIHERQEEPAPTTKPVLDFSSIEGHQLHLREPQDGIAITDGIEVFSVPRKYVAAILKAVPELRYSFEHIGGKHLGRAGKTDRS